MSIGMYVCVYVCVYVCMYVCGLFVQGKTGPVQYDPGAKRSVASEQVQIRYVKSRFRR